MLRRRERILKQKEMYSKEMRIQKECEKPQYSSPCKPMQVGLNAQMSDPGITIYAHLGYSSNGSVERMKLIGGEFTNVVAVL